MEYITSRQEKTKRCTKLDKNVAQRYVKARQRRNKTATENYLLLRGLFIRDCFLFRWPFLHYICNLSSFNTVVIGQLQWHHILCFAAAISYRKWSNGLQGRRIYKVTLWLNFSYNYSVNLLQILHLYIHPKFHNTPKSP